jgi:hypothetical protein
MSWADHRHRVLQGRNIALIGGKRQRLGARLASMPRDAARTSSRLAIDNVLYHTRENTR